ncbi:hypothetical protein N658DRAFT_221162 [Parathielavia hyrcaniae]|uniref:Uncharacterized protein n=1 Tax=Parathielavia hyrcaniae TaxID=113614 RepID=A0AAN6SYD2_9PEZI|nr:hypothetical protein N658DRAFT_221162 [Parathielavia hyrcaniae]
MAVLSLRWLVAVSAWLPAVAADLGRGQPIPRGPLQTMPADLREPQLNALPPVVTARAVPMALQKRAVRTCGYVDGDESQSYACAHPDAECLRNTAASAVGCCGTTDCFIYTACIPSVSSAIARTINTERTRHCSDSRSPSCATLIYADPTNTYLSGYTIPICARVETTYEIYWSPTDALSSTRSSTRRTTTASESEDTSEETSEETSSTTGGATGTRATTTATTTSDPDPPVAESSTPIGPIVGGVVGGVAALGLLGLAIFFLIRRKKKIDAASVPTNPAAGPAPPGFMPPPGQPGGPYSHQPPPPNMAGMPHSPGAFDPHYSMMMKPPGATGLDPMQQQQQQQDFRASTLSGSTPGGSPSPVYHPQMQSIAAVTPSMMSTVMDGTPPPPHMGMAPPPQQQQQQQYAPYPGPPQMMQQQPPPPQQQQQQQYPGHGAAELPTQRGDGQVHELS